MAQNCDITFRREEAVALIFAAQYFLKSPQTYYDALSVTSHYPAACAEASEEMDMMLRLRSAVNDAQHRIQHALDKGE